MGQDVFAIIKKTLVRRFSIYDAEDTNYNPTRGTRQIEYKLKNGETYRLFVIDKTSEY